MRFSFAAILLSGLSLLVGCTSETSETGAEELAFDTQEIVNGTLDSGHPAAVALTVDGFPFCSGTLVTPTVVVTAAHCISPEIGSPPWEVTEVFFGANVFDGGTFIGLVEGLGHPDFDTSLRDPQNDIAVLRLSSPAPVAPIPMAALPATGTTLTLVGFGITEAEGGDSGLKRVATASIADQQGSVFVMELLPSGTCNGDSGGTALWNDGGVEKLVGIHTRSDCETVMLNETVGSHIADFVQPFIDGGVITCEADGACASGCPSPDPDCPCADDGHCTTACPNLTGAPDCNPQCVCEGTCIAECPVPDPDCSVCIADDNCNEACASDPDCESGVGGGGGGDEGGGSGVGDEGDGCGCRTSPSPVDARLGVFLFALVVAAKRRRRRRVAS